MPKFMIEYRIPGERENRYMVLLDDGADQAIEQLHREFRKEGRPRARIVRVDRMFTAGVGFSKGSIMKHGDSPKCGYEYGVNAKGRAYCKGCKTVFPLAPLQGRIVRHTANALKTIYGPGGLGAPINGRYVGQLEGGSRAVIVEWSDGSVGPILESNIELDPTAAGIVVKGRSSGVIMPKIERRGARYVSAKIVEPGFARLRGDAAVAWAEAHGERLCKYADPSEGWRDDLSVEDARAVAREDSTLIYVDAPVVGVAKGKSMGTSGPVIIQQVGKHGGFEVSRFDGATKRRKVVQQYGAAVVLARKESQVAGVPIVDRVQGLAKGKTQAPTLSFDVYADDGFVRAYRSEYAAVVAAARGSRRHYGVTYTVVQTDSSGGGRGTELASYFDGRPKGNATGNAKGLAHGFGKSACIVCLRAMAPRKDGKAYHAKCERIYRSNPRFYEMSMRNMVAETERQRGGKGQAAGTQRTR